MAYLLNKKDQKQKTIREELMDYLKQVIVLLIIVIFASIGFYRLSASKSSLKNEQLLLINDFYTDLQEERDILYDYVINKEELRYQKLCEKTERLKETLNNISNFHITISFRRDIEDLIGAMENYEERIKTIHRSMIQGVSSFVIHEIYNETETIYNLINNAFQTIYSQVLDKGKTDMVMINRQLFYYTSILVITITLTVAYIIWQTRGMEKKITHPIQNLTENVRKIDLNNIWQMDMIHNTPEANNEIELLVSVYNSMLDKIQKQFREHEEYINTKLKLQEQRVINLEMNNQLKKSQLLNLQRQINPHFLFNTLNMISHSALLEGDIHTVALLETTSDLLRYALDYSDKAVSLEQEIENIGNYVYLQEQRFGERIRFLFDLDESFHYMLVPNLILQPLVENAIIHGVGMYTEGGEIIIQTAYDETKKMGRISIIDNGEGMDEEKLKQVKEEIHSVAENTGKIGLANVFLRLQIFFDNHAEMDISSVPHTRTEITLLLPCKERKGYPECIE